jgi:hypothetical protein
MLDFFGRVDAMTVLETHRERMESRIMREQVEGHEIEYKEPLREPALIK